jgi:5-formyltetrahydrofolate cyclo-ligase
MPVAYTSEDKERMRSEIRRDLEGMVPSRALAAGVAIDALLCVSQAWLEASEVAVFASLSGEVDTGPLMRSAAKAGKIVLLPRMLGAGQLEFAAADESEALVPGPFGIREPPASCPVRPLSGADLMLVPGLAFDRHGGRLGRGAGYYDRALAGAGRARPLCLGIGFALQLVERVPMTPLDALMDGVVTEEEFFLVE